jgi:hypothetical protein
LPVIFPTNCCQNEDWIHPWRTFDIQTNRYISILSWFRKKIRKKIVNGKVTRMYFVTSLTSRLLYLLNIFLFFLGAAGLQEFSLMVLGPKFIESWIEKEFPKNIL